ncbi:MAG: hypothetical protein IT376_09570 [Polyangiaceae bacterium]|nr:hypothetical protein [Polyangiaceae bacterium]
MRLGLLGPAHEREDALEDAVEFLLREAGVDRAVYLGVDRALDTVIHRRAERLVGASPDDANLWQRATDRCARATPAEIDAYLAAERERRALSIFESLPDDGTRLIELLDGKVLVMIHDKGKLDEDDILPASLIAFGRSRQPLVRQVGSRWFLSPGSLEDFGIMTLEDSDDGIHLALFDRTRQEIRRERLLASRGARVRVAGTEA